ncbi:hypothetical protein B0H14DRAFT_2826658 [Mycena olivaceomarginata]|nr:hypothetical protein B0H14DRAFT_2826658 [Mycena olivaceomarginata]
MEALMFWIFFSYFLSLCCFKSSLHLTISISINGLSLLIRSGRSSMFAFILCTETISASATTSVITPSSPGTGLPAAAA